jgi:hypothetical protein
MSFAVETVTLDEKTELLHLLKIMWKNGDSSLRRIYPSWEELENHIDIKIEKPQIKSITAHKLCPYCGVTLRIKEPIDELFPYDECKSCKHSFHVGSDLEVKKLTDEEEENMPAEWVRVLHALDKKKLAIIFKLE